MTREQIRTADMFYMFCHANADGTPVRWRRNGRTKIWKTRPHDFKIPVKHGMYDYGYITPENMHEFTAVEDDAVAYQKASPHMVKK